MSYTTIDFQQFLTKVAPFDQLPEKVVTEITPKFQPWRYRMGQVILRKDKIPSHLVILYEGQARLLGYDPRTQMPTTLELFQPGEVFGWINFIRDTSCETVIASTEVICLALKKQDFLDLLAKYPEFKAKFENKPTLIEVFDLAGSYFNQQAQGEGDLKQIAKNLIAHARVEYLSPGKTTLDTHPNLADPRLLWLVSGGEAPVNFPIGSHLHLTDEQQVIEVSRGTIRLIGLPAEQLQLPQQRDDLLSQMLPEVPPDTLIDVAPQDSPSALVTQSEEAIIPTDPESEPIPYAKSALIETGISDNLPETKDKKRYPFIRGKTPLESGMACFQMICQYFGMPFRRDIIRRVLSDQLQRMGSLSLPLCGAITELMGLNSQLITINSDSILQIKAPALIRWQDTLAIIYEINSKRVVIAVPEIGILRRKPADFIEAWGAQGEVLLLQKSKETPQRKFGLNWFIPALIQYRRVLVEVFIASFFVQLFALANPLMIQVIIDKVIVQNSPDTLHVLGIFLLIMALFEALLGAMRTNLFVDTTNRIDMSLGSEIIDHLLRLPLRYFERRPVGEISTRVNELENIRQFLTGTALTVVLDALFSVVYIVVMLIYSVVLTAWALAVVPILVIVTAVFSPVIRKQLRTKAERNAETQSYLVEVMSGIQTVKAQNIELRSRWQWQERYARYVSAGFNTVITSTFASSLSNFFNKLSGLLVLWVGAYLVLEGELTLGQLIAFRIIAGYVTSPILRLTQLWQNFQETALSLERLADIVDTPQEAEDDRDNIPMPLIKGSVKFENVSFRFQKHGPLQLYNVNLEFPAGTFVALVGQSGAGKSTLTKLLSRLYEPESGRILVDGYDINKVELYSLRRQIGVVPQETLLFDGTVQENIALTNPDASIEEIVEAAQVAAAHEFIMNLPSGYNTRVGERGASLSGGQRQRIAIARSVLQRPQVLVLDEATSALDYATEQQVCVNLSVAFKDRTVFFITHRLASIRSADTIVMMDAGTVVEIGTHSELMAMKGRYYYLYQQQEANL
ncbi:cyclic nucleotide-regulated ABC bacteriocin/lantibiotic exporter [Gloeothece citriformis PCC 7424]|uniref:Cyclic nucleotide-regulated ABC bacteriocin/lantibiotic exporter n=1 Tax=Gloeothece citriformis (strain PCC 7424) TaxID=65393 RepID=B7KGP1_GLOC7|nr:peptidase domain-containing ABC transporter [Gloeothece citriformis]ACK71968.1 cyclic nucleotide-regulated ABC bacteriocin/lantibiotic exporter [Gloeothece citriformis PCC 7424]